MPIRLVLAGDHPFMLAGLEALLRGGCELVLAARCRDAEEAVQHPRKHAPDILVLVLHLRVPRLSGLEVLRTLCAGHLRTGSSS